MVYRLPRFISLSRRPPNTVSGYTIPGNPLHTSIMEQGTIYNTEKVRCHTFAGRQAFQQLVIANARRNEYRIPAWCLLELPFNTSSNIPTNHPLFQSLSCTHHFHHRTYLSSSTRRLSCSFCLSGNEKQKINYSTSQCHVD